MLWCFVGGPNEVRTRVFGVRGRRPRPLDDGTFLTSFDVIVSKKSCLFQRKNLKMIYIRIKSWIANSSHTIKHRI